MKTVLATLTVLAVALSPSGAIAGIFVSGPIPSEFAGGFIGEDEDVFRSALKIYKEGAKLSGGVAKCFSKGAKNFSKGKPSAVDLCINGTKKGVLGKYLSKVATTPDLAPCSGFASQGAQILGITKAFNGAVYCQSPSGAFLDGGGF